MRRLLVSAVLFTGEFTLLPATHAVESATPPCPLFGVNIHADSPQYRDVSRETQLLLVQELGADAVRWDWTQEALEADWTFYEQWLTAATRSGIQITPVLGPSRAAALCFQEMDAATSTVEEAAYAFGREVATRFRGRIRYWELGNEYDGRCMVRKGDPIPERWHTPYRTWAWGDPDGSGGWHYGDALIARVAALYQGLCRGLHEGDPLARTILNTGGYLHYGFVDRMRSAGVAFDILAWHWYSDMGDDLTAVRQPEAEVLRGATGETFDLLAQLRRYGKPLWFNEINHRSGDLDGKTQPQADYLERLLTQLGATEKVEGIFVYELLDELFGPENPESYYGLVRRKQDAQGLWSVIKKKPASAVYEEFIRRCRERMRPQSGP